MEMIECKVRQHLTVSIKPNEDHQNAIAKDVLTDTNILEAWDSISVKILPRYESYSLELLQEVIELWIRIRCHSFAKCYTMKQQQQYFIKHGTRKTLKMKNTDKEVD